MFLNEKEKIKNKKVLLMLSGGKDSAACLHLLKSNDINVIAIHFVHNWCYDLVTNEARKICEIMNVPLEIYDFSKEFVNAIDKFKGGRPCLLCKEQMYKITLQYALEHHCQCICVGDNANDTTTIARVEKGIVSKSDENIFLNSFLSEKINLPSSLKVIRPIVNIKSDDVIKYLKKHDINILRVGDTGDKYFEYSREGCPVQFHDPGSLITIEDMEKLREYNTILSEFARNKSIRAAIHIPSEFIVTVPKGYEIEAKEYLISKGVFLKEEKNNSSAHYLYLICLQDIYEDIFEETVSMYLINRLFERLEIVITEKEEMIAKDARCYLFKSNSEFCNIFIFEKISLINICLVTKNKYERSYIENLIIEIFRTYKYSLVFT